MRDFVRELYLSDLCGACEAFKHSEECHSALNKQENIYNKLASSIEKSDFKLFEEYLDNAAVVKSEELFHAYVSGMKDLLRLLISVFDEQ